MEQRKGHLLKLVPEIEGNIGLNFGNPERHDPESVLEDLKRTGKCYFGTFPQLSLQEQIGLSRSEGGGYHIFSTAACKQAEQQGLIERFHSWLQ